MMDSSASGSYENCCVMDENMPITNLFLNNNNKFEIVSGWMRIPDAWILDNWEFNILSEYKSGTLQFTLTWFVNKLKVS
jgi:hypothetical protein